MIELTQKEIQFVKELYQNHLDILERENIEVDSRET